MYRRMVFDIIAKNCNDHTKNFAFRLKEESEWEIAPAYYFCHACRSDSIWVIHHTLSINGKRKDIDKRDLITFVKAINIKKSENIISEINNKIQPCNNYADEVRVSPGLRDSIQKTLLNLE